MRRSAWRLFPVALAIAIFVAALPVGAQSARDVFERYADRVVQIEVAERKSGAKASIGSGFAISARGRVITNFHVVAEVVHHPNRYRAELVDSASQRFPVRVIAIDVLRDLALVESARHFAAPLLLGQHPMRKGARIFALGNPYDLGLSIVEGTYNGLLEHSLEQKIHFTGSLNPGMSGGPALDPNGAVVGVNVATSGNQVSFLVPADAIAALLASADRGAPTTESLRAAIGRQLRDYQARYLETVFATPPRLVNLGRFRVPSQPAPFFNCWGDTLHEEEDLYEARVHECSSDDMIYLSKRQQASTLELRHRALHSDSLSATRFYVLYSELFEGNYSELWGSHEDFTPFRCRTRFVETATGVFKTAFCARRYLAYPDLFDVVFKAALLGEPQSGLETALALSAVSFENAERLAQRHLEAIAWNE